MSKKKQTVLLLMMLLIGVLLVLYPSVADYWNARTQSIAINSYAEMMEELDDSAAQEAIQNAQEYNRKLNELEHPFMFAKEVDGYESNLNVSGDGLMGYITIDKITVQLPVYHGTEEGVLSNAVGHVQGSSLPAGGPSSHAVLSAHRGLPSARLFTDLGKLDVGDMFTLTIMNKELNYRVDQVLIVLPEEIDALKVVEGEDYCTLVTCTPYAINTHRLLVRGVRVDDGQSGRKIFVPSEANMVDPLIVALFIAVPLLFALMLWVLLRKEPEKPHL